MYLCFLYLLSATSNAMSDQRVSENSLASSPLESFDYLNGFSVVEGDILTFDFEEDGRNAIRLQTYLWENGTIPYTWGDKFDSDDTKMIHMAMRVIESKTCIKFVERTNEKSYIRFSNTKQGCYAAVGRLRSLEGPLPVNFQRGCLVILGIPVHELLHVVGLFHEQSRPDRDNYVDIHWANVDPTKKWDFRTRKEEQVTTYGVPYDYDSIMHYSNYDFSINGKPTITAKGNPSKFLGQRIAPSAGDIEKVLRMYKCNMTQSNTGAGPSMEYPTY